MGVLLYSREGSLLAKLCSIFPNCSSTMPLWKVQVSNIGKHYSSIFDTLVLVKH